MGGFGGVDLVIEQGGNSDSRIKGGRKEAETIATKNATKNATNCGGLDVVER
jgi:hypothetical protein